MDVNHCINELVLARATTVLDQKCKYLASGNSQNQNAFLSESKLNPKGNSPSVIYNFPKLKVWGTAPASAWIIYIKQDNFFSALPGIFRLHTVQEDSAGLFFVVQNQETILLHFRYISPSCPYIHRVKANYQMPISTSIVLPLGDTAQLD